MPSRGFLPYHSYHASNYNIFEAGDGQMMAVFLLDLLACLMLLAAAANVARQANKEA